MTAGLNNAPTTNSSIDIINAVRPLLFEGTGTAL